MKHVIIGTAGHVDHGKTALVKALTGVDTDRLEEEKRRGLTIEPGFARLDFADGTFAGVVDVPGHEKFIKNMLAGAGGIDLAMLVVAADEGFMPQTVEHLDILSLLGVRSGLVALTKCDLVDEEGLALAREEITARVKGTFLEGKPVMEVSAVTGQGVDALRDALYALVQGTREKNPRIPFRLPVDRVFSVDGFGTVATGTLIEGVLRSGDEIELAPGGAHSRVRGLQVHGESVDTAYAGQRVAVNLAGWKKTDISRGDVLIRPESIRASRLIDARLSCLKDSARTIKNGSRVHFCHGTAVQLTTVVLLDHDTLAPGKSGFAQLRLSEEAAVKKGDCFVVRFYSPLETIGGGVILDPAPPRRRRHDAQTLEALAAAECGGEKENVLRALSGFGCRLPTAGELAACLSMGETELAQMLAALCAQGEVCEPMPGRFIAPSVLDVLWTRCGTLLTDYHEKNPLHAGVRVPELRQKLFGNGERAAADALLGMLAAEGKLKYVGERIALADFTVHYTKRQRMLREQLLERYHGMDLRTEPTARVLASFSDAERTEAKQVMESLLSDGELISVGPGACLHREAYERVLSVVRAHFAAHDALTLAQLRDALGTSRDNALMILEMLDRRGVTRREGDLRRPGRL